MIKVVTFIEVFQKVCQVLFNGPTLLCTNPLFKEEFVKAIHASTGITLKDKQVDVIFFLFDANGNGIKIIQACL
jgi:hypothetical protein